MLEDGDTGSCSFLCFFSFFFFFFFSFSLSNKSMPTPLLDMLSRLGRRELRRDPSCNPPEVSSLDSSKTLGCRGGGASQTSARLKVEPLCSDSLTGGGPSSKLQLCDPIGPASNPRAPSLWPRGSSGAGETERPDLRDSPLKPGPTLVVDCFSSRPSTGIGDDGRLGFRESAPKPGPTLVISRPPGIGDDGRLGLRESASKPGPTLVMACPMGASTDPN
mmetsp:Transcript_138851/g.258930  ORF Transcript_138851/g.258930 Transcript_138851/m.258930 type:complete len:219 (+) Transcript_138851:372-1028(+)